jgi:outer membrane protein
LNLGSGYNIGFQSNLQGTTEIAQSFNSNLGISSSVILYNGGSLKLNLEKSLIDLKSIDWVFEKTKNDLTLQIIQNYYTILLNKEIQKGAEKSLEISTQNLEKTEKLFKAGKIPEANLYEVKATNTNDKQIVENAKINCERAKFNLTQTLQLENYKDFELENFVINDEFLMQLYDVDEIVNYSYLTQPKIKEINNKMESALVSLKIAQSSLKPSISLNYSYGVSYLQFFNQLNIPFLEQLKNNQINQVSLGVSVPIYSKFQNRGKIEQEKINIESQKLELEKEKLTIRQTILSAYFDVNSSIENYKSQKQAVESFKKALEFSKKSYDAGFITIYDYTISRNNYFISLSKLIQTKYDLLFKQKILAFYRGY